MHMRSPLFGLETSFFAGSFFKMSAKCLQIVKALARLCLYTGLPEPLLVAYMISTLFLCAG